MVLHKQKFFHFFKRNLFCRIFHWKVRKWRAWTRSDVFVGDYFVLIHENAMCLPAFNSINVRLVESLIERKFYYYSWNYQQHLLLSTHWGFIELNWTGGCFASINASKRAINFQQSPYSISVQTAFSPTQFRLFRNFSWNAKVSIEVSFIKLASNLVMKLYVDINRVSFPLQLRPIIFYWFVLLTLFFGLFVADFIASPADELDRKRFLSVNASYESMLSSISVELKYTIHFTAINISSRNLVGTA